MVTRVERYAGHCTCCGGVTLAGILAGLENSSPFSVNIVAMVLYLRLLLRDNLGENHRQSG